MGAHPAVTACKSATGHLLGASGAVEAVFTVLTLVHGLVPAVRNPEKVSDGIDLDLVWATTWSSPSRVSVRAGPEQATSGRRPGPGRPSGRGRRTPDGSAGGSARRPRSA
ncbi:hypothetical protein ABZ646_42025 [Streptomyces sp. NPDC007162]|uniref:hypothetical protein n=1 Tax=Streptomyces sp. NPDC007162 TaxID=3156917 RepID=UPI0033E4681C